MSAKRKRRKTSDSKSSKSTLSAACRELLDKDACLAAMVKLLDDNHEPYYHTTWRREPWPVRPYQLLDSYQVADDAGEEHDVDTVRQKMITTKECTSQHRQSLEEAVLQAAHPKFATPCKTKAQAGPADDTPQEGYAVDGPGHRPGSMGAEENKMCVANAVACGRGCDGDSDRVDGGAISHSMASLTVPHLPESQLRLGVDVEERAVWGMDSYTRRALFDALGLCSGFVGKDSDAHMSDKLRVDFIEHKLLPAVQRQGQLGWDMAFAVRDVKIRAEAAGEAAVVCACEHLLHVIESAEAYHTLLELHKSKKHDNDGLQQQPEEGTVEVGMAVDGDIGDGNGVRAGGNQGAASSMAVPEGRTVFRLHPKGQGIVCVREGGIPAGTCVAEYLGEVYAPWRWFEKQDILKKQNPNMELPDFYNITLERPKDHPGGYDVLFVEAAHRGNFASRLCHSCTPNCHNVMVAAAGKLTNVLFTSRHIQEGEELTWDYACVTESEKEYAAAVCLCGTQHCRGSFLYYANSSSFMEVMSHAHTFLDRNAAIIRAVSEGAAEADRQLLRQHGICSSVLDSALDGGTPAPPWVIKWATIILNYILMEAQELPKALVNKGYGYDAAGASTEAYGVRENRLQNLAITIDKIKYFLRHQPDSLKAVPPLRVLSTKEVCDYLWNGKQSVARRLKTAALPHAKSARGEKEAVDMLSFVNATTAESPDAARQLLLQLGAVFQSWGLKFAAAYDLCMLYGNSHTFFQPVKFQGFSSQLGATKANATQRSGKLLDAKEGGPKRYHAGFLWGQLVGWFKQTVYDPSASLSADRRGSMSLPDPESAFASTAVSGKYAYGKERFALLDMLKSNPANMWPIGTIWSFKNSAKVYGSPMLEAALRHSKGVEDANGPWETLLAQLKTAF